MSDISTDFDLNYCACPRLAMILSKRLTPKMFEDVFKQIDALLGR